MLLGAGRKGKFKSRVSLLSTNVAISLICFLSHAFKVKLVIVNKLCEEHLVFLPL